ncbi:MAG TPA: hypothetical protein VHM19_09415 [Polyangiales bacterium]|nr:hypothetical protein [Polyangiales bacterium]
MASEPAQAASWRSELIARLWLTAGVLLGYAPLLGFDKLIITDDGFVSDIWNGELPVRAYLGQVLREHGHLLTWYDGVCSGAPSVGLEEPLSVSAYTALSPGAATCALFLTWVLIAAHGSYWLARRSGASRAGAVLSGLAFAMSGYLVTQLKHMSLVGTCVWLPTGLALLDTGLGPERTWAQRALRLSLFGCVFGEQVLCGFPQSIYICGLVYGAYALQRVLRNPPVPGETFQQRVLLPLMAAGLAVAVGAAAGAISLLPLAALGAVSDRSHGNTWEWATQLNYDPKDLVMFVAPYANGDASDGTFHSKAIFWEDYGYVGLATFLLALYAIVRERRSPHVRFFALWAVIALLFVLGPATPVFRIAFEVLPGF